ncbi:MAG: Rrf2 family transcriptional regulator [Sulfurimonas sp. RIFOXYD12_FULL_33_39]|uniref:RrF2 family transcriptional regulator n=1 Tax=unclassified Sulfurimonas TaxID=2623549 RepID=UPI0008BFBA75|nr:MULTISPECIES: Rrf2 family transcriptional regulator [unclassified Sulfurimonas]OHE07700.1 MAG: Rrf2 family transcriptional regulator [Sulfurimonas sp. RIFCSPLOWO2_12_FULL_34_6]OHE10735.1 MAG: Rrf2 family transcriptional regulator [Sulfurimonas sp. RIFOXYD12_FULL_33_39]OHE13495.1 MAG: Rrf2 family transcriptional regulator [Sulfurimonas sp. RIFOXYD2_FULL_34_21]
MSLLSTKGSYGLAAICELTKHKDDSPMHIKDIAQNANIPQNYLEQLLGKLRRAGIVKSIRGAKGGYVLAKDPENIKILDILVALEDELKIVDKQVDHPVINLFFGDMQDSIKELFDINILKLAEYKNRFLNYTI